MTQPPEPDAPSPRPDALAQEDAPDAPGYVPSLGAGALVMGVWAFAVAAAFWAITPWIVALVAATVFSALFNMVVELVVRRAHPEHRHVDWAHWRGDGHLPVVVLAIIAAAALALLVVPRGVIAL